MIFAKFLMLRWQNKPSKPSKNINITVIAGCQRQKSWQSWFSFILQATVASSISIRKRSASICATCFLMWCHTTGLLNWNERLHFLWLSSSRRFCWENVLVLALLTVLHCAYAEIRGSAFIRRSKALHREANALWGGSSDSNCIWYATKRVNYWISWLPQEMSMIANHLNTRRL